MLITIRQIEIFLMIVQEKSIAAASEKLYLSKPAVSMALNELESRLKHLLFDRVKNRLILNYYGQQVLSRADELYQRTLEIEQLFSLEDSNKNIDQSKLFGKISIGASNTIGNYLLPNIIQQFRLNTGHTQQKIIIDNSENICSKIADYKLDLGLVESEVKHDDLVFNFWQRDQMCVIAAPKHSLIKKSVLNISDLNSMNWILREPGSGSRSQFMQMLAPSLKNWHLSLELTTTESIINCVQSGIGLAFVSKLAIETALLAKRVTILPLQMNDQFVRKLWIVNHKDKYHSPLMSAFINSLDQYI
ncbi:MAG: DNA-binding transcriptional LysR family regulator [Francisellaceae bacterium]|jgi:DNA-binding transcriptional LysR family regulator